MDTLFPGLFNAPNVHPLFVHFPIVLWAVAALFLVIGAGRGRDDVTACGRWLLYLGAASSVVALVTGYLATESMGHGAPGHEFVHDHKYFMLVATAIGVVAATTMLGADRGANLVFQHGIGTPAAAEAAQTSSTHGH